MNRTYIKNSMDIFFWKPFHAYGYLSNWYRSNFTIGILMFTTSEQAMMYYKAKLFDDFEMMEKIMETTSPARVKKLGRKVKGFDEEIWRKNRRKIVEKVLLHKFKQNKDILVKLLSTKGSKLYEASPYDKIWGIGLVESNARLMDKSRWPGENLLGELLMKVRSKLIRSRK